MSYSVWDDEKFPATAINPPGLASDPDFDSTNGGWLFDAASTELIFLIAQLPHSYEEGSDLHPHVHWQKTTSASGNVYWQLDYKIAKINEVMDAAFTTLTATSTVAGTPDTNTANKHLISAFSAISDSTLEVSDMLVMKLSRIGGNAADTYGADVRLLEFDIHIQKNAHGTTQEYSADL